MNRLCQSPSCDNRAIWGVKTSKDKGVINVCVKHYGKTLEHFRKLTGEEPQAKLL